MDWWVWVILIAGGIWAFVLFADKKEKEKKEREIAAMKIKIDRALTEMSADLE